MSGYKNISHFMSMRPPMVRDTQGSEMYCVKCIGIVVSNLTFYIGDPSPIPLSPSSTPPILSVKYCSHYCNKMWNSQWKYTIVNSVERNHLPYETAPEY